MVLVPRNTYNSHSRYTISELPSVNTTTIQIDKKTLKKLSKLQAHYSGSMGKYVSHDAFIQHLLILYEDNNEIGEAKHR